MAVVGVLIHDTPQKSWDEMTPEEQKAAVEQAHQSLVHHISETKKKAEVVFEGHGGQPVVVPVKEPGEVQPVKAPAEEAQAGKVYTDLTTGERRVMPGKGGAPMVAPGVDAGSAPMEATTEKARVPSVKGALKRADLPTSGPIRYVPPETWHPTEPLPRGENNGYIDRFGNEWVKGPSRTSGEPFEWDVQLGKGATEGMRKLSPDGSHVNVSMKGKVTH